MTDIHLWTVSLHMKEEAPVKELCCAKLWKFPFNTFLSIVCVELKKMKSQQV